MSSPKRFSIVTCRIESTATYYAPGIGRRRAPDHSPTGDLSSPLILTLWRRHSGSNHVPEERETHLLHSVAPSSLPDAADGTDTGLVKWWRRDAEERRDRGEEILVIVDVGACAVLDVVTPEHGEDAVAFRAARIVFIEREDEHRARRERQVGEERSDVRHEPNVRVLHGRRCVAVVREVRDDHGETGQRVVRDVSAQLAHRIGGGVE